MSVINPGVVLSINPAMGLMNRNTTRIFWNTGMRRHIGIL